MGTWSHFRASWRWQDGWRYGPVFYAEDSGWLYGPVNYNLGATQWDTSQAGWAQGAIAGFGAEPETCPPGHEYSVMAQGCVCPPGFEDDPNGNCVQMDPQCPPPQKWNWTKGECETPVGAGWEIGEPPSPKPPKPILPPSGAWAFIVGLLGGAAVLGGIVLVTDR